MATKLSLRRLLISRVRRNKFKAVRVTVGGIKFHSKAEARRYLQLKRAEDSNVIWNLELQPKFKLVVNDSHVCTYIADFSFRAKGVDSLIVEDVKGVETDVFRLKAKLFRALFPQHAFYLVKKGRLVRYK